jgi:hypothetical protein
LGYEQRVTNAEIAQALGLGVDQVERIVNDIASKERATTYLRMHPLNINGQPIR